MLRTTGRYTGTLINFQEERGEGGDSKKSFDNRFHIDMGASGHICSSIQKWFLKKLLLCLKEYAYFEVTLCMFIFSLTCSIFLLCFSGKKVEA